MRRRNASTVLYIASHLGVLVQNCNLVLSGASGALVWASNTAGQGAAPCSAVVSSARGGSLAVLDSTGVLLYLAPASGAAPDPAILQHRFNAYQTGALCCWLIEGATASACCAHKPCKGWCRRRLQRRGMH